eukprot:TRINITY_DN3668_c0_g1_i1.p1 TRINITY_DN3668_c0_g1~~TRINITY_DN3668_c0_g1_i1.p1  ORF type:complete len:362 (-),score=47.43 TRINITY_DN3668_c0_g1_i1:103-1188(-)
MWRWRVAVQRGSSGPVMPISGFQNSTSFRHQSTTATLPCQAVEVTRHGGSEVLHYKALSRPVQAEPGSVLIKNAFIGVNYIDTYLREGKYPSQPPFVPGKEGAGEVVDVGEGVTGVDRGDRIAYFLPPAIMGAYSEYISIPARYAIPVPKDITLEQAAAVLCQGMTAHMLTEDVYSVRPGDTMLVHAAAGGMGLMLCQIGKSLGAHVIGTASSPEKAERAKRAGAEEVIDYTKYDFAEVVRSLTHGRGVHVVYDGVGKTTFLKSLDCLKPRGTMALYGAASGQPDPLPPASLGRASLILTRPSLFHYVEGAEYHARAAAVFDWLQTGRVQLEVTHFALKQARDAHDALESRQTTGKILLVP